MEQLSSILLGYIAKQYGISEDAAAELLFEKSEEGGVDKTKPLANALEVLVNKDQERVTTIKSSVDTSDAFTQGYNKATSEVLEKTEKRLAKKHGIEYKNQKLGDLIKTIIESNKTDGNEGDLTDDKVKTHPLYLALERSKTEEINNLTTAHEKAIQDLETGYAKEKTMQTVSSDILGLFDELKPVLSQDQTRAQNQRNEFAKRFGHLDFEKQSDGSWLITQEGKRLEDSHGNPLGLKSLVRNEASKIYDFKVQDERQSTGNAGSGSGTGSNVNVPSSEEEYNNAIFEATTAEEREAITKAYEANGGEV